MFPAVYALLPAKTQEVYESMFELLISHAETKEIRLNPKFIMVDFELASINTLKQNFQMLKQLGVFFIFVKTYIEASRRMVL